MPFAGHMPEFAGGMGNAGPSGNPYALSALNQEIIRNKLRTEFYPFVNEQLKELVQQIDMYI